MIQEKYAVGFDIESKVHAISRSVQAGEDILDKLSKDNGSAAT